MPVVDKNVDPAAEGRESGVIKVRSRGDLAHPVPQHHGLAVEPRARAGHGATELLKKVAVSTDLVPCMHRVEVGEITGELA
jgi:hypothetical protein